MLTCCSLSSLCWAIFNLLEEMILNRSSAAAGRRNMQPSRSLNCYNHGEGLLLVESSYYQSHILDTIKTVC